MNSLIILFVLVPVLIIVLLLLNYFLAPHKPDFEKNSPFECGFSPIYGQTRSPFHIQFYIVAILFLVLDLEIFYVVPFTIVLYQVGSYGFTIFLIFFTILTIGFIYEIAAGVLKFGDQRSVVSIKNN